MRSFLTDDELGSGGVAVVGDESVEFADLCVVAEFSVGVEGQDPVLGLFGGEDGPGGSVR